MIPSSRPRGATPRTLFKIILMLGLALAGVAAIAAEPEPQDQTSTADASPGCTKTTLEFGGRTSQGGESTDAWTLTCWRPQAQQAAAPKPVDAQPVATRSPRPPRDVQGIERF